MAAIAGGILTAARTPRAMPRGLHPGHRAGGIRAVTLIDARVRTGMMIVGRRGGLRRRRPERLHAALAGPRSGRRARRHAKPGDIVAYCRTSSARPSTGCCPAAPISRSPTLVAPARTSLTGSTTKRRSAPLTPWRSRRSSRKRAAASTTSVRLCPAVPGLREQLPRHRDRPDRRAGLGRAPMGEPEAEALLRALCAHAVRSAGCRRRGEGVGLGLRRQRFVTSRPGTLSRGLLRRGGSNRRGAPAWITARVLVLGALALAHLIVSRTHPSTPGVAARVHTGLLGWDAGWYESIARYGYVPLGHPSFRFFPSCPL